MPTNDMTPQQRAVRVYELLLIRPRRAGDIAGEIGLSLRATYDLLRNLPIPVYNSRGWWSLIPEYEIRAIFEVYRRMRENTLASDDGDNTRAQVTVNLREMKIVMSLLERFVPPDG